MCVALDTASIRQDNLKCTGSKPLMCGLTELCVNDLVQALACAEQGGKELFETDGHQN